MPRKAFATFCLAVMVLSGNPAIAQKKVALVIGIDAYQSVPRLERAVADSRAVAEALRGLGFKVRAIENADRRALSEGFSAFEEEIDKGDTAFVFFAGHGVEIKAQNLLLPADAPSPDRVSEGVLKDTGFLTSLLIERITDRGARAAFFVFDACRNNPYAQPGARRSVGSTRGLAQLASAPEGVFVLMSAGQNQEALDSLNTRQQPRRDSERNSVFTRVFLDELSRPGQSHLDIAKNAQQRVRDLAREIGHVQVPAFTDQVIGRVVFREGAGVIAAPSPALAPPQSVVPADPLAVEFALWNGLKDSTDVEAIERFAKVARDAGIRIAAEARARALRRLASVPPPPTVATPAQPTTLTFNASRSAAPLALSEERGLKPKDSFRECAECPEMVVVPAGTFVRGSPEDEESRAKDEGPQRRVTIGRAFAVGKFELTFAEWDECVLVGGCGGYRPEDRGWGRGRQPVINVSWNDAQAYADWLSRKTGKAYRLLTEAEWEYAARAGTTTAFSFGPTISPDEANYDGSGTPYGNGRRGVYRQKTTVVGSFRANAFGLHDLHGNVWEWVADCYANSYTTAPTDGSVFTSSDCSVRVLRGGSWSYNPRYLRSAYRSFNHPVIRVSGIGFRLARTLSP